MRSLAVASLLAGTSVACVASPGRSPEATPPPVVVAPPPSVSASASASASAPPLPPPLPPLPPPVGEAAEAVCSLTNTPDARASVSLFLPGKEQPFGWFEGGALSVHLPPASKGPPVADVLAKAARVRAQARLPGVPVFSRAPLVMEGIFVPHSSTPMRIASLDASSVTVEQAFQSQAFRVSTPTLRASVSCANLSLSSASFRSAPSLPDTSSAKPGRLREGQTFALRASEKGAPVVEITTPPRPRPLPKQGYRIVSPLDATSLEVSILKTSGKLSQVVFESSDGAFFGWIPGAQLLPPPKPSHPSGAMLGLLGSLGGASKDPASQPPLLCEAELPLILEQEGSRVSLGSTLAGACIEVRDKGPEFARVGLHKGGFSTNEQATLLTPSVLLVGCRPADPKALPDACAGMASDENGLWGVGFGVGGLGLSGGGTGGGLGGLGGTGNKGPAKDGAKK